MNIWRFVIIISRLVDSFKIQPTKTTISERNKFLSSSASSLSSSTSLFSKKNPRFTTKKQTINDFGISNTTLPTTASATHNNKESFTRLIPGLTLGIPLNILSAYYTTQHYGTNIITFKLLLLQFLLGFYVYGGDRLRDAIYYKETKQLFSQYETFVKNNNNVENVVEVVSKEKQEMYKHLYQNKKTYETIFNAIFLLTGTIILNNDNFFVSLFLVSSYNLLKVILFSKNENENENENEKQIFVNQENDDVNDNDIKNTIKTISKWKPFLLLSFITLVSKTGTLSYFPFLILLDTTNYYIEIKQAIGILKPLYIAVCWVVSFFVIPCLIHEQGNLQIDADFLKECVIPTAIIFSGSLFGDIKDIDEDRKNKINTIPVVFGKTFSLGVVFITMIYTILQILDIHIIFYRM